MSRLTAEQVALDDDKVRAFFEQRGRNVRDDAPLSSVCYQDKNPQLAVERDAVEKRIILSKLGVDHNTSVLDIGCGIGRWGTTLAPLVRRYHGVDFSESLLDEARQRVTGENVSFAQVAAQDVAPGTVDADGGFDVVVIAGVLIYLNDDGAERALRGAASVCAPGGLIYVREPAAYDQRLTLVDHWSTDMESTYNAIYRSDSELADLFARTLTPSGFRTVEAADLFPAALTNRAETRMRYFLFRGR